MKIIVTKETLDIFDKYDGDFGLLDEPWASKKDRERVSIEQSKLLSEYVDKLNFIKLESIPEEMKRKALDRISELELAVDIEVIRIIRERMN